MIASWWGSTDEVLSHTQKARADGLHGIGAVRLTGLEARALAQSGKRERANDLLHAIQGQRDKLSTINDDLRGLGEAFTFPAAREHYYNAATHTHADDWRAVEQEASKVISLYETPETGRCWPATMTLSRVYLAQARLHLSGPEGAYETLLHVFNLPNGQRVHQTVQALSRIRAQLGSKIYSSSPAARNLDEAIRDFNFIADSQDRP